MIKKVPVPSNYLAFYKLNEVEVNPSKIIKFFFLFLSIYEGSFRIPR